MISLDIPIIIFPGDGSGSGGGGGVSNWYKPSVGAPTVLPIASGTDALASGNGAVASGGNSIASGTNANAGAANTVAVGPNNTVTAAGGSAWGVGNTDNALNGTVIGNSSTLNGAFGFVGGYANTGNGTGVTFVGNNSIFAGSAGMGSGVNVSGQGTVALGVNLTGANTQYSTIVGYLINVGALTAVHPSGLFCKPQNNNEIAWSFNANDTMEKGHHRVPQLRVETTDATPTLMTDKVLTEIGMLDNSSMTITGRVTAFQTGGIAGTVGDSAGWVFDALVSKVAGVYTLVGSNIGAAPTAPLYASAGTAWTIQSGVAAGGFNITVTGEANKDVTWFATFECTQTR